MCVVSQARSQGGGSRDSRIPPWKILTPQKFPKNFKIQQDFLFISSTNYQAMIPKVSIDPGGRLETEENNQLYYDEQLMLITSFIVRFVLWS